MANCNHYLIMKWMAVAAVSDIHAQSPLVT